MASCSHCKQFILFGGVRDGGERYCNDRCYGAGQIVRVSHHVPEDIISRVMEEVHQGSCPRCQGRGPVDVHTSHFVWSALVMTQWKSTPQVSCRSCGLKSQLRKAAGSALIGWWGFPWGLIMTPIQIVRNLVGVFGPPDPTRPSAELRRMTAIQLAANYMTQQEQAHLSHQGLTRPPSLPGAEKDL